ncbi:hypothetical protein OUZ56_002482 [Daphnia magna]|uniref:Uncharacterized protein n=1 Tax=Daphnia magna TaxID=35525 RepID=A0ABR0A697_9CRUS|nr:hypothetical protein OUZ56_002482 [Daphnia magna]
MGRNGFIMYVTEMGRQKMKYDNGQKLNILGVERCSEGDGEQDGCALVQATQAPECERHWHQPTLKFASMIYQ